MATFFEPFSGNDAELAPLTLGGSFTSSTVTVTVCSASRPPGSVTVIFTGAYESRASWFGWRVSSRLLRPRCP